MKLFVSLLLSMNLALSAPAAGYFTPIPAPGDAPVTETTAQPDSSADASVTETAAQPDASSDVDLAVSAPSVILMEASTGTVIYEKNSHDILHPASITKIMTLILIFDALERGQISLDDTVTVSDYAASMGGSQVFLEPGETQTVDTMIKCISVASANDACVAMAEFLCGSESEFVRQMHGTWHEGHFVRKLLRS